jgi:hypothetical protein
MLRYPPAQAFEHEFLLVVRCPGLYRAPRVRRIRATAGVIVAVFVAWAGVAAAESENVSSTSAFIAAATQMESRAVALDGREKAAADALIEHVRSGCPSAIPAQNRTGTPAQQRVWMAFYYEAVIELVLADARPLRSSVRRSSATISRLRWSDKTLDTAVRDLVRESRATLSLRPPDLCQQAATASASGFETVPIQTRSFLHRAARAMPDSAPTLYGLARRMRRYLPAKNSEAFNHLRTVNTREGRLLSARLGPAVASVLRALLGR